MEKNSEEERSIDWPELKEKRIKTKLQSKFSFALELNEPSSTYDNPELQKQASMIRRSKKFLEFLNLEFKTDFNDPADKLLQFELLKMLFEQYVKYAILENQTGDCLDEKKMMN